MNPDAHGWAQHMQKSADPGWPSQSLKSLRKARVDAWMPVCRRSRSVIDMTVCERSSRAELCKVAAAIHDVRCN